MERTRNRIHRRSGHLEDAASEGVVGPLDPVLAQRDGHKVSKGPQSWLWRREESLGLRGFAGLVRLEDDAIAS